MAAHVPFKKTDVFSSLASLPCALPGRWLLTALQATAGGNLTWLRDNVLYHEDELLAEEEQPDVFKIFDQIARRVPPGSNGVLYTPWIWGERAPVDDRTLRAGLYNLSLENTREDIVRAFLEGVALNTRWLLGPVRKFLGRPVQSHQPGRRRRPVGGVVPDLRRRARRRPSAGQGPDPGERPGSGVDRRRRARRDLLRRRAAAGRVRRASSRLTPRHRAVYDERYRTFLEIHKRMRPLFRRINRGREDT